jgi:hypothetical protein
LLKKITRDCCVRNYGHAMLISNVRTEVVAVGFGPSIAFAHRRPWNPIPPFYDLTEPLPQWRARPRAASQIGCGSDGSTWRALNHG